MEIGISINLDKFDMYKNVKGYDFLELSDFIFPQYICNDKFVNEFHKKMQSGLYIVKCMQGPIRDIKPESSDPDIRAITEQRFITLIKFAKMYGIKYILFNTTFDPLVRFDFYTDMWMENNIRFWKTIIPIAEEHDVVCLYSNVWDDTPYFLKDLFVHINSKYFRFGFDIGHMFYISELDMDIWFDVLGSYTDYILLHDNYGGRDDHIKIGTGKINFQNVFKNILQMKTNPDICIQLFDPSDIQESLDTVITILKEHKELVENC